MSVDHSLQESVRDAYDEVAEDYAALIPDTRAESAVELAMVDSFAASVGAGAPVLDAGCGAGRMSAYLAGRDLAVQGIDLSPGMVRMARRDHPGLPFVVGSISDLPYPDGGFGGVLLWYSTIHIPPEGQARLYREAARVLQPGGYLLVGCQSGSGVHDTAAIYREYGHDVTLLRHRFTADDIAAWLDDAGLTEQCRLVRRPVGRERDDQAFVLARSSR
ncbi:MAG TPA: class I SAM-dependent methyltransferase [Nocardioidaceae bacterium]|nr:class I SAM-dependent methyltransferase [Nocardioidaceae bacterium]